MADVCGRIHQKEQRIMCPLNNDLKTHIVDVLPCLFDGILVKWLHGVRHRRVVAHTAVVGDEVIKTIKATYAVHHAQAATP